MTTEIILTFAVLGVAIFLFVSEWLRVDVAAWSNRSRRQRDDHKKAPDALHLEPISEEWYHVASSFTEWEELRLGYLAIPASPWRGWPGNRGRPCRNLDRQKKARRLDHVNSGQLIVNRPELT